MTTEETSGNWRTSEINLLGRVPDSVLARRTGRTIKEVVAERARRRIRLTAALRRWTAREIGLLGRFTDAELARRLARTKRMSGTSAQPCTSPR